MVSIGFDTESGWCSFRMSSANHQYLWSVLVLTGTMVGVVFKCLWPIGMGVFVIRHFKLKCSQLALAKSTKCGLL